MHLPPLAVVVIAGLVEIQFGVGTAAGHERDQRVARPWERWARRPAMGGAASLVAQVQRSSACRPAVPASRGAGLEATVTPDFRKKPDASHMCVMIKFTHI